MLASDVITPAQILFGDTNKVVATDAACLAFLNDGIREIARQTLLFQATVTTTGAAVRLGYDMSAVPDLIVINRVTYDGEPIALMTEESIDRLLVMSTPDGTPVGYYTSGQNLKFYPRPLSTDALAVVITYSKLLTAATAVSSTVSMPDNWRTELIDFIVSRLHQRNENWRAAEYYDKKFASSIADRKFEAQARDDTFLQVVPDIMDQGDSMWDGYIS